MELLEFDKSMGSAASMRRDTGDAVAKETVFSGLVQHDVDKIEDRLSKSGIGFQRFVYEVKGIRRGCKRFVLTDGEQDCTMFEFAVPAEFVQGVDMSNEKQYLPHSLRSHGED